jgi:hypothetical protein
LRENIDKSYLASIEKIRTLLEKYSNIGFYIDQLSDTVSINKDGVKAILDRANWAEKRGRRYYYRDTFEEECRNMSFYQENDNEITNEVRHILSDDIEIDEYKIRLLDDPEQLIKYLKRENSMARGDL